MYFLAAGLSGIFQLVFFNSSHFEAASEPFWFASLGGKKALRLCTTHISIKLVYLNAIRRSYRYLIIDRHHLSLVFLSDSKSTFMGYWYFIYMYRAASIETRGEK